jgi:predicted Ser/Thr protein kinase
MTKLLGLGASGCVYAATWEGQAVAVKLLHPNSDGEAFVRSGLPLLATCLLCY